MTTYNVRYELDEAGNWVAKALDLEGCHTFAPSISRARMGIREAMSLIIGHEEAAAALLSEVIVYPTIPGAPGSIEALKVMSATELRHLYMRIFKSDTLAGRPFIERRLGAALALGRSDPRS